MCKRELCEQIVALVAHATDITQAMILSQSRRADIVDARYLAIYIMLQMDVKAYRIAEYMSMTERNVYHVLERFEDRKKYGDPMIERYYSTVITALKQV